MNGPGLEEEKKNQTVSIQAVAASQAENESAAGGKRGAIMGLLLVYYMVNWMILYIREGEKHDCEKKKID